MTPTEKLRDAVGEQLESTGIAVSAIEVDDASGDAVRVEMMHRAKASHWSVQDACHTSIR